MAYKRSMPYVATMTSGLTLTSEVDLDQAFDHVLLGIPTMASGTDVRVQVAGESGGTYRNIYLSPQTGGADAQTAVVYNIDSGITQAYIPVPVQGCQHMKVELTTAMTATSVEFEIVGISL